MPGNRYITLCEILPSTGSPFDVDSGPQQGRVFPNLRATVDYTGGSEQLEAVSVVSERRAVWRVRQIGIEDIKPEWTFTDDTGGNWRIDAITEPKGRRGVYWLLHASWVR